MDDGTFLKMSNWWGLSSKPGYKELQLFDDGTYVKKTFFTEEPDKKDNSSKQGVIDPEKLKKVREFLEANITGDSKETMSDAGDTIDYKMGDKWIKVENNKDLWDKLTDLIPEYKD